MWAFQQLKIEAYPDLTDPTVVVITLYPGFAAEEVEQQVTVPIERALNNTPFVISRRSRTIFGLSVVELTFEDGTNDYLARQLVLERVQDAQLPEGVTPTLGPLSGGVERVLPLRGRGARGRRPHLREIQDWVVAPRLLQVPGVADVATFGGLVRQYEIEVDPRALDKYRLSIRQVADAVKNNNRNAGGALLRHGPAGAADPRLRADPRSDDIENIVLDAPKGVPIFVRDIGRVQIGTLPQTGIFAMDDQPLGAGGVEGIVLMRRGENPSEVLPRVRAAVDELNATRLPQGVRLVAIHDRSDLVESTLRTVSHVLVAGFLIVIIVLLVFLLSVRAALLTALIIPLSLLFALVCMYASGVSLSLLSIGALDFGIIVDGTIVMVERIIHAVRARPARGRARDHRRRRPGRPAADSLLVADHHRGLHPAPDARACRAPPVHADGAHRLLRAARLAAAHPHADPGARHLPVSGRHADPAAPRRSRGSAAGTAERSRASWTAPAGSSPRPALVVAGALYLGTSLGTEFLPQLDEGVIWIRANLPAGISLEKSAELARQIRVLIRESPEVKLVASQTGRNDSGTDPFGPNRNELLVDLRPYDTWRAGRPRPAWWTSWRAG